MNKSPKSAAPPGAHFKSPLPAMPWLTPPVTDEMANDENGNEILIVGAGNSRRNPDK